MRLIDKIKETASELEKTGFMVNEITGKCGRGKNMRKFKAKFNVTSLITGHTKDTHRVIIWL